MSNEEPFESNDLEEGGSDSLRNSTEETGNLTPLESLTVESDNNGVDQLSLSEVSSIANHSQKSSVAPLPKEEAENNKKKFNPHPHRKKQTTDSTAIVSNKGPNRDSFSGWDISQQVDHGDDGVPDDLTDDGGSKIHATASLTDQHHTTLQTWGRGIRHDLTSTVGTFWKKEMTNFQSRTLAVTFFLFFACVTPAITFGVIYSKTTGNQMGAVEMLVATAW